MEWREIVVLESERPIDTYHNHPMELYVIRTVAIECLENFEDNQ